MTKIFGKSLNKCTVKRFIVELESKIISVHDIRTDGPTDEHSGL